MLIKVKVIYVASQKEKIMIHKKNKLGRSNEKKNIRMSQSNVSKLTPRPKLNEINSNSTLAVVTNNSNKISKSKEPLRITETSKNDNLINKNEVQSNCEVVKVYDVILSKTRTIETAQIKKLSSSVESQEIHINKEEEHVELALSGGRKKETQSSSNSIVGQSVNSKLTSEDITKKTNNNSSPIDVSEKIGHNRRSYSKENNKLGAVGNICLDKRHNKTDSKVNAEKCKRKQSSISIDEMENKTKKLILTDTNKKKQSCIDYLEPHVNGIFPQKEKEEPLVLLNSKHEEHVLNKIVESPGQSMNNIEIAMGNFKMTMSGGQTKATRHSSRVENKLNIDLASKKTLTFQDNQAENSPDKNCIRRSPECISNVGLNLEQLNTNRNLVVETKNSSFHNSIGDINSSNDMLLDIESKVSNSICEGQKEVILKKIEIASTSNSKKKKYIKKKWKKRS